MARKAAAFRIPWVALAVGLAAMLAAAFAHAQAPPAQAPPAQAPAEPIRYKAAVVALTEDAALRKAFEDGLVTTGRERDYDAVTSYDLEPNVTRVNREQFLEKLADNGIRVVLMLRPAAIGEGSSLEAVRGEVPDELLRDMQQFARQVSETGDSDDLVAVVHLAIYVLAPTGPRLVSSGAVWLDEETATREQRIERLKNLIAANVDRVRPAIRDRLRLPPLP